MKTALQFLCTIAISGLSLLSTISHATEADHPNSGLILFQEHCASCHIQNPQSTERLAPPIFAVKNHYLPAYRNKEDFVKAVVKWVRNPNEAYSLMPGARMKFGLMPAIELDQSELQKIAEFIFDSKFNIPGWYAKHYREEHGKDPEITK